MILWNRCSQRRNGLSVNNGRIFQKSLYPLLRGTSVQVRIAEVVERRVERGRDSDMWLGGLILKERIPLLASPRGGVAASPRKRREASLWTPPVWCSLSQRSEHHPFLAKSGCYAILS